MTASRARWLGLAPAAAVAALYWRALNFDFVNYDDTLYVTANAVVQRGLTLEGLRWAFQSLQVFNWHPLTLLSHMADCHLYGLAPRGHHLTSVLLHAANASLLWLLLRLLTGRIWESLAAACLFALHPLRVESVAWVAERKDVLSGFFWLSTMILYVWYARAPSLRRYAAVAACFLLGLMSKPMVVTLPFALLLLDYWPLGRVKSSSSWRRLAAEKAPLFVLSLLFCAATLWAQRQAMRSASFPFAARLANAVAAYAAYLGDTVWPSGLAAFYPFAQGGPPPARVAAAVIVLAALSAGAVKARRSQPQLLVGWLWFLGTLLPVIGLLQVGNQAMADRYTYIPHLGLALAAAATLSSRPKAGRAALIAGAGVALLASSAATALQLRHWKDSEALWTRVLDVSPGAALAHNNLANALKAKGKLAEAIEHYRRALALEPDIPNVRSNLAAALAEQGGFKGRESDFTLAESHYDAAMALARGGRTDEALARYRAALRIRPDHPEANNNLGVILFGRGLFEQAERHYRVALKAAPGHARAHNNLGAALARQGRWEEAARHFEEAVRLEPRYADARGNLARTREFLRRR